MEQPSDADALPAGTAVGRVGLRVDDLDRVVPFYRDAVGCRVERDGGVARLAAADGRTLVVFEAAPDAPDRPAAAAGLYHLAIRLPDRAGLADALARLRAADVDLEGASDHLVSEALYLRDPAGNGVELYRDRPRDDWPRLDDGRADMDTLRLDLADLARAGSERAAERLPPGTDLGHVHLEVTDLAAARGFYEDALGLRESSGAYPDARFLAAGDYHHHVAVNTWNRRREPAADHQGLRWFELVLPGTAARDAAVDRLRDRGYDVGDAEPPEAVGPDGIRVRLAVREDGT